MITLTRSGSEPFVRMIKSEPMINIISDQGYMATT